MTREELQNIFGDSLEVVELSAPSNRYKIDVNAKFNNYAVYYNADFTKSSIVKAQICDFKKVKKHGVIPSSKKDTFNCMVGDYYVDEAMVVLKDLKYEDFDFMSFSAGFGEYEEYSVTYVLKDNLNKFVPYYVTSMKEPYGWYGFFTDLNIAKDLLKKTKLEEIKSLKSRIQAIEWF